ncbi:MAG: hypothetical protein AAF465_07345 [Pseudomonadota bacterium]
MPSSENFDPSRICASSDRRYGIRASLKAHDGFDALMGADWETTRWYATAQERDRVLATIGQRHAFSRIGDAPAVIYRAVDRDGVGEN